jgi:xanthine dehydrogenase large subunit
MTVHDSSFTHVSGESCFIDDIPTLAKELCLGLITSEHPHAEILSINGISKALEVSGVVAIYKGDDFKSNLWGTIFQDQPLLASQKVHFVGEPILVIAATSPESLRIAKKFIQVKYRPLEPILSIDEAINKNSFVAPTRFIKRGNLDQGFKDSDHVLEGVLTIQGQEHFYLEPQTALCVPEDGRRLKVFSSTQHPTEIQHTVAHCLDLPYKDVTVEVTRLGGGFGGKESQATPFAAYAALVAHKTGRPARIVLSRDEDMIITGKRNPFKIQYKVGFNSDGVVQAMNVNLFSDSGAYADLSTSIMERAMLHSDNAYFTPHVSIEGTVCRTHRAPTTAFRGFGGPKGVAFIENILEEISRFLKKDSLHVRRANLYGVSGNLTPYGQEVSDGILPKLFDRAEKSFNYHTKRKEIDAFNKTSKTLVKGLSLTSVKFGISFTTRFLNQGSALVNLQTDGTVQVSTGAVEMGQGVNTKIAQVVAEEFGIKTDEVRVTSTSTEKIHNTSPTAASSGADINASAARNACLQIKKRLIYVATHLLKAGADHKGKMNHVLGKVPEIEIPNQLSDDLLNQWRFNNHTLINNSNASQVINLKELITEAYLHRVHLGALGFFKYDGIYFNKVTGQGIPFFYFTQGVALSEVQIDLFTGELKVLSSSILMDLGRPLNEGIDRGQTLGAFVQGLGWVTSENLVYSKNGALLTHAPSTYKIPSIQDIPREIKIDFEVHSQNSKNIRASKAVGEPPLLLCLSVWTAAKNALAYARPQNSPLELGIPLTQERIFEYLNNTQP